MIPKEFVLPQLPYAYNALEPHINETIMTLHHSKHHQTYVNNLNAAYAQVKAAVDSKDIRKQVDLQNTIKFNAGGHINHSLFWENLAPASSPSASGGFDLKKKIVEQWGSFESFEGEFTKLLLGIQGSGWGWLAKKNLDGTLVLISTKDQDPVPLNFTPLIGIDFWEHAYYVQYYNNKADYIKNIYKVLNWENAELRWKDKFQLKL